MRELVKKRNLRSKTFDLGGRKRLLRLGIKKPLHYVNEQSQIEDIDLTPTLARGQHFISKAPYKARIGRDFPGYRYTGARGTISAELIAINGNSITKREPEYADKRFYWRGLSFGVDCTIIPRNAGLNALVTLHEANAPRKFTWEILGDTAIMRPVVGRDALGRTLELEQEWSSDRLTITWTGKVIDGKYARRGEPLQEPRYPVWIDPTINEAIVAGSDDAWSGTPNIYINSTYLSAGIFGTLAIPTGLRFQTIAIPQGSTVTSAVLTLDILSITGSPSLRIYGNDIDDANAWSSGNRIKNITKTTAFASFSPGGTGTITVGVTSAFQEIINRTGFTSNNDVAFGIFPQAASGVDIAKIAAYEHTTRQEAQLDIVYTEAGAAFRPHVIMF